MFGKESTLAIVMILLVIAFIIAFIYALDSNTYIGGCKELITFTDDTWKSALEWGNILCKILVHIMKAIQLVILLIMFSIIYAVRMTFVLLLKRR